MSLKLDLALMILFFIIATVFYFLTKKYKNKRLLIITYVSLFLVLCGLIYATLDIILVGGM